MEQSPATQLTSDFEVHGTGSLALLIVSHAHVLTGILSLHVVNGQTQQAKVSLKTKSTYSMKCHFACDLGQVTQFRLPRPLNET
jgi:hypothetical protein